MCMYCTIPQSMQLGNKGTCFLLGVVYVIEHQAWAAPCTTSTHGPLFGPQTTLWWPFELPCCVPFKQNFIINHPSQCALQLVIHNVAQPLKDNHW